MRVFNLLRADRVKLASIYGENTVEFYRAVFLSILGRFFAAMLIAVHLVVLFPGTPFLDNQTKFLLAPFIAVLVGSLIYSAMQAERGREVISRHITNATISLSTMISVILCGGFLDSHATPFLIAPIVVTFCISPRNEAIIVGTVTFFLPLLLDLGLRTAGIKLPDYTSLANPEANTLFLLITLFISVFISLTYLQKTNTELHTALNTEKEILRTWANMDPLTKVGNRRSFETFLENKIKNASQDDLQFSVLFLDLNDFKSVNDMYGHEVGDEVLKEIARRLKSVISDDDAIARLGGDEFGIVLGKKYSAIAVEQAMAGFHKTVSLPIEAGGQIHNLTTSLGYSIFPKDSQTASELVRAADFDMYARKMANKLATTLGNLKQAEPA